MNKKIKKESNIRTVKLANELNELQFDDFGRFEIDMFNLIVNKLCSMGFQTDDDEDDIRVRISINEINKIYSACLEDDKKAKKLVSNNFSKEKLSKMSYKLLHCLLIQSSGDGKGYKHFTLFSEFEYKPESKVIEIVVTKNAAKWFRNLGRENPYCKYPLLELLNIKGKHSKRLYMLLSRYNKTHVYIVSAEELKFLLAISEGYKSNRRVTQIVKEMCKELNSTEQFHNLECLPVYNKKTRETSCYRFVWGINK